MVIRLILLLSFLFSTLKAESNNDLLNKYCMNCHREQKIPSELIYRRYLLTYSTDKKIKNQLSKYLKNPNQKSSIMPKQFFLKFPEKKALNLNETFLEKSINAYLEYFDIKKKLILK